MRHGDDFLLAANNPERVSAAQPAAFRLGPDAADEKRRRRPGSASNPKGRGSCGRRLRRSSSLCPLNTASSSLLASGRNPKRRGPKGF